jgi:hypothetical protein
MSFIRAAEFAHAMGLSFPKIPSDPDSHDRDQIRGDVAFDLLRDFYDPALALKARQYLDEAVYIARHEKEKKKQHRREKTAGKVSGPLENDSKDKWQYDLACHIGCRQQRQDVEISLSLRPPRNAPWLDFALAQNLTR